MTPFTHKLGAWVGMLGACFTLFTVGLSTPAHAQKGVSAYTPVQYTVKDLPSGLTLVTSLSSSPVQNITNTSNGTQSGSVHSIS